MRRVLSCLAAFALVGLLVPVFSVGVALADDATVVGPCSEAEFASALATAQTNGGGTITFDCGGAATIGLTSVKTITSPNSVIIDGADLITLDGGGITRLFDVDEGASLELRNISLTNGYAENSGGAIYNDGTLNVVESTLTGNIADASAVEVNVAVGGLSGGGAILNDLGAVATITDSTLANNLADSSAFITGAIFALGGTAGGAAVYNFGSLEITGSTFFGNVADATASGDGGGGALVGGIVLGGAVGNAGTALTITNSTFSDNHADASKTALAGGGSTSGGAAAGGAIHHLAGTMTISTTTVTLNSADTSGSGAGSNSDGATGGGGVHRTIGSTLFSGQSVIVENSPTDCTRDLDSNDYNLDSDGSCAWTGANDISNGDAGLAPLTDNGGPTLTHAPAFGADAVDNGPVGCIAIDQRGLPRPVGPACDNGSVELQTSTFPLCADYFTGRVLSPFNGPCKSSQLELVVPDDLPLEFCISPFNGLVYYSFGDPCDSQRLVHIVPDDGDLLTCVSYFTTANRPVVSHDQCNGNEEPNIIPAV